MTLTALELGALDRGHRERLRDILEATNAFRDEEIEVALELLDADDDYEFIGAFTPEGELTGYVCYGPTPGTDGTYDLYWIAVHPDCQGSGAGSRLVEEVERRLIDRGGRLLVVETSSRTDYEATRRFYERRGYQEHARLNDFYAVGDDRVIACKRLYPSRVRVIPSASEGSVVGGLRENDFRESV